MFIGIIFKGEFLKILIVNRPVEFGVVVGDEACEIGDGAEVGRQLRAYPLIGELEQAFFVMGFDEPFKEQGVDLAIEFPRRPRVAEGFDFVKRAGGRVGGLEEGSVVGP